MMISTRKAAELKSDIRRYVREDGLVPVVITLHLKYTGETDIGRVLSNLSEYGELGKRRDWNPSSVRLKCKPYDVERLIDSYASGELEYIAKLHFSEKLVPAGHD